jgi:hypothetical protein
MDKNTCGKGLGLGYMTKGWFWAWSLMMTCGDVWYIHRSYNVYVIWQGGTPISITPGGGPGVQLQQRSVQETWGESWWEEIVRVP